MTVAQALSGVELAGHLAADLASVPITGVDYDSRRTEAGQLFFAFLGERFDGRRFAQETLEAGAVAVVCEAPPLEGFTGRWIMVKHGRRALATTARNLYQSTFERVSVTGVTGTNGKTTTAYLIDSIARAAGCITALIGTIEYQLAGKPQKAINTTPESLDLYRLFSELAGLGGTTATMEVSSHALQQGRVHGLAFHTAVFTNLTRDHLDYHGDMDSYFAAKQALFTGDENRPPRFAVLNRDDEWLRKLRLSPDTELIWFGFEEGADVRATKLQADFEGIRVSVNWKGSEWELHSPMLGRMNAYNILAAVGASLAAGFSPEETRRGIAACPSVPGRFERIEEGQPFLVVVDYAHTDDALRNVISAARELNPKRVITLFGCGGDRDRTKRPLMGQAAAEGSDFVVFTSDNPRSEDPVAIMNDGLVGLRRTDVEHKVEPDREAAIRIALSEANTGDIVLITGKGHETHQVLKDRTIPFDDREVARRLLHGFGYGQSE
jgi:UDP-N-acetylmuramoyl-L-alanyl-D-glutamate--2,6-diaminopimelate ligase